MAAANSEAMQQLQQQRFQPWSHSAEFPNLNAISKHLSNSAAAAAGGAKGTACGYDMLNMDAEESGVDLYGQLGRSMHHGSNGIPTHHVMVQPFMHHPGSRGVSSRKYPCKMCNQVYDSKSEYQLHVQSHMREPKPYKCSQCPKSFANSSYLSQHMRIHLGIKPYHCDTCKKKFTQLSHLQQHIRTHTGDKPYRCPQQGCNKAFSQLSNLQSHSRCHQTDKPYKCNSCYKCFYDENALVEHIPKHKDSKHLKTHICNYCGKSYTQETYLARHMSKHADKMEKQHRNLVAHIKTTGEVYWPKQETSQLDAAMNHHSRMNQEDLVNGSYNSYTGYPNPYVASQYSAQSPGYDMCGPTKNGTSAFSVLPSGGTRNVYYGDPYSAMKGHNGLDKTLALNGHHVADHFSNFNNVHGMRSGFGFSSMPTMLPDSSMRSSGALKDNVKQQRYN